MGRVPRCLRDNRCNSTTRGRQPGRRDDGCRALAGSASARPYLRWALRLRGYQHRRLRRPSCPSRRPRPERVRFFETTRAAESAGYRACRRCHPTSAVTAPTAAAAIQRALRYLSEHSDEAISLAKLAQMTRLSASHLQREFKRALGVSPREYQAACRAARFRSICNPARMSPARCTRPDMDRQAAFTSRRPQVAGCDWRPIAGRVPAPISGSRQCAVRWAGCS